MLLAANRDEDPARPSKPPLVLAERPRVVGGRDAVAGGTWLAIRGREAAVALLNRRRDPAAAAPRTGRRSRGLLTLDVAGVDMPSSTLASAGATPEWTGLTAAALQRARELVAQEVYAPFTLVWASARDCWALVFDGQREAVVTEIRPGWHVLTHADLDDPGEPRTAHLLSRLAGESPATPEQAEELMIELLRSHGEARTPPVCLHQGRMRTVSASLVLMSEQGARYRHADGRPCETAFVDHTPLLAAEPGGER